MILSLRKYRPRPPPRHGICDISHDKSRRLCKPTLHVPLSVYGDHSVQLMRWPLQGVVVVACPHRRRHTHARTHTHTHTHTQTRRHAGGRNGQRVAIVLWASVEHGENSGYLCANTTSDTVPATPSTPMAKRGS